MISHLISAARCGAIDLVASSNTTTCIDAIDTEVGLLLSNAIRVPVA